MRQDEEDLDLTTSVSGESRRFSSSMPSRSIIRQSWAATHLEELQMSGNNLNELPLFIQALEHLKLLDISHNALKSLSAVCSGCVRLVSNALALNLTILLLF